MAKNLSETTRIQIVATVKAGKKLIDVAKTFGVSRQTVGALMRKNRENNGDMATRKGAGRLRTKLTKANRDKLAKLVKRNP